MLHTVNKSPFEKNSLETCLRLAEDNSSILLIEDGRLLSEELKNYLLLILNMSQDYSFQMVIY